METQPKGILYIADDLWNFRLGCEAALVMFAHRSAIVRTIIDSIARNQTVENLLVSLRPFSCASLRLERHIPLIISLMDLSGRDLLLALADFAHNTEALQTYELRLACQGDIEHYLHEFLPERDTLLPKIVPLANASLGIGVLVPAIRTVCTTIACNEQVLHQLMLLSAVALATNVTDQQLLKSFVALDIVRDIEKKREGEETMVTGG